MLKVLAPITELQQGLARSSSIAGRFTTLPIMSNVLLQASGGRLNLTATDFEITFKSSYDAEVLEEGSISVPAKTLCDIANSLSGSAVRLEELESLVLEIKTDFHTSDLLGISSEEFPQPPDMGTVSFTDFPSSDIIDAINKTIYSVVPGNSNFNLGGIFWEKDSSGGQEVLKLASTDNNRLNVATLAAGGLDEFVMAEGSPGFIISRKSLSELKSLAEGEDRVALGVGASCLVAKTKNSLMIMRHLSGQFPKYQALIPTEEGWVITVSRKDFIESLRRLSLLSAEKSRIVYFAIHDGGMIMSIANKSVGQAEEKITISYTGPDINVGFDPKHLLDSLNSLKSERVSIRIINNKNPAVVTGEADPGYLGIITTVTPREEA